MSENMTQLLAKLAAVTERAERAEAELKAALEQEPVVTLMLSHDGSDFDVFYELNNLKFDGMRMHLYASPIPAPAAPAPEIPDGDDFNGTTPHLIQCIEALVRMNDHGVLVPHGIGSHARTLLLASANRLRQQPAPSVPEEWREVMAELAADLQAACDAEHPHREHYPSVMRKYLNDMVIVERARALLKSVEVKK